MLPDINCAASFLDNFRQVSMADRSAWRQRSWTRNALAVIEIEIQVSWIQVQLGDSQEQNRYDELVWSRGGATTAV